MPKIDAPTVAEHRAHVQQQLVDAAEELLRAGEQLTAGAVTKQAGIARNSIYRYVESVDDLRVLVVERYLPGWIEAVTQATTGVDPADAVVAWVGANLEEAARHGHAWFANAAQAGAETQASREQAHRAHEGVRAPLVAAWSRLLDGDADRVRMAAGLTVGLLDAAFAALDGSVPHETVRSSTLQASRALVEALGTEASHR